MGGLRLNLMGSDEGGLEELVELSLSRPLEIANTLLEFGDPSLEGLQHGQDGNLGFRWDGVPEWFRDRRLRLHANNTTDNYANGSARERLLQ